MRLAVRYQLSILLVLSSCLGLAILALAIWFVNYSYVLDVASKNLEIAAALKARELSVALDFMYASCLYITAMGSLQQALMRYNNGSNTSAANWEVATANLIAALSDKGLLRHALAMQAQIYSRNGTGPAGSGSVLAVTGVGHDGVKLPFNEPDGSAAYLGQGRLGYPPALYPNLTYKQNGVTSSTALRNFPYATYNGITLSPDSELVLGPLLINESFSLLSMTMPVIENNSESNVLGWMTIVQDAKKIQEVVLDRVALGKSGINLLLGPVNKTNYFPPKDLTPGSVNKRDVRFLYPIPGRAANRHTSHAVDTLNPPFRPSEYPAVEKAMTHNFDDEAVLGTMMRTHNEDGSKVSVAYAVPQTPLADWIIIVEKSRSDVWQPINHLRDIVLACFFSVFGFFLFASFPMAYYAVRPIQRLRDAARGSIDPLYSSSTSSLPPGGAGRSPSPYNEKGNKFFGFLTGWRSKKGDVDYSGAQEKRFRIPSKVEFSTRWLKDDLTDLSETFNEMVDELYMQYCKLEERIRERTAELEASKLEAEAANHSKTMFVANVSHELKTPLNGILGMCAISIEDDDVNQMKTAMSIIYKSGDMLLRTLNDLLTFSTNQVGGAELSLEEREFIMQDLEFQVRAIFTKTAEEKQVKLFVEYDDAYAKNLGAVVPSKLNDMRLWGDVHRILQVAINLVSNSLKYTSADGSVTFVIRRSSEPAPNRPLLLDQQSLQSYKKRQAAMMTAETRGKEGRGTANWINANETASIDATSVAPSGNDYYFEFEVKDTGQGIPENMQARIFEPFVQGETGLDRKHSGTGLGLSICSQLAKLMRGTITVQSALGEGSKFTVKIPLRHVINTPSTRTLRTSSEFSGPAKSTKKAASREDLSTPAEPRSIDANLGRLNETPLRAAALRVPAEQTQPTPKEKEKDRKGSKASQKGDKPDFSKYRILVAEDNKVNQQVVLRMLKLEQVLQVTIAEDGAEALDLVKTNTRTSEDNGLERTDSAYDLILMDIQMPNMDGLTSAKLIREAGHKIPIVALTAFAEKSNVDDCYASGMDHFLAKPLKRPQLRDVLQRFCSGDDTEQKAEQE